MIIQQLRVLPHDHGHMFCESSLIPADHMNSKPPVYVTLRRTYYHMSSGNPLLRHEGKCYVVDFT